MGKPTESEPRKLCRELLELRTEHRSLFDRIDAIKARLITLAEAGDEGLREVFDGLGRVSVSAGKPERTDGIHPEVVEPVFYALPKDAARGLSQAKLIEAGVIIEQLRKKKAYHGRVDVKLIEAA